MLDSQFAALEVPSADTTSWACPWNACGQWTTFYNDPSGTLQGWVPGYFASRFPVIFMQTDPVTYGLASGLVGGLTEFSDQLNRTPTKLLFGDRHKGYEPKGSAP